jgi:hypothetical protein
MKIKNLCVTCIFVAVLCAPSSTLALVIDNTLKEGDFFGRDSAGDFYYNLYQFASLGTDPITITLESSDFAPFVTWGLDLVVPPWPLNSDAPYDSFIEFAFSETPGAISVVVDSPLVGQTFFVLVKTTFYNPTDLGAYTLIIDGDATLLGQVPVPATLALLGLGLMQLGSRRRSRGS